MKLIHSNRKAFTLLEIMLVVCIIALILGAAVKVMGPQLFYAQDVRVQADISSITTALRTYQSVSGSLPTTEQGLKALVKRPEVDPPKQWHIMMDKLQLDPWQHEYFYEQPGKHNPESFDVYSAGSDGKPGTDDDIGNWEKSQ